MRGLTLEGVGPEARGTGRVKCSARIRQGLAGRGAWNSKACSVGHIYERVAGLTASLGRTRSSAPSAMLGGTEPQRVAGVIGESMLTDLSLATSPASKGRSLS